MKYTKENLTVMQEETREVMDKKLDDLSQKMTALIFYFGKTRSSMLNHDIATELSVNVIRLINDMLEDHEHVLNLSDDIKTKTKQDEVKTK